MPDAADLGMPGLARVLTAADEAVATAVGPALGAAHRFRFAARLRAGDGPALEQERAAMLALAAVGTIAWADVQLVAAALALLAGRFADGQRLAHEHGDSPDANALLAAAAFWTDDVVTLDALRSVPGADRAVRLVGELSFIVALARRGDLDAARKRLVADDFADPVAGPYRASHLAYAAAAARALDASHRLPALEAPLHDYAGELLVAPVGMVAVDAADSLRGSVFSALGRHDEAFASFEAAAATCARAGAVVLGVVNDHRYARALVRRNAAGDRARAAVRARAAFEQATRLGMQHDARFARNVLQALDFEVDL